MKAFLVCTGTAANSLALSALTPPYGAIFCHNDAHINNSECNAPEFFSGGAKVMGLAGGDAKLTTQELDKVLQRFDKGVHDPKPATVSLANATELGTVYTPQEVRTISSFAKSRGMKLHMDGARFANALAHLKVTPAALTWQAGVDVLSLGATKNGAMMLEAVIFFDKALGEGFDRRRMRSGQLLSKGRYLGAQMLAYLENDLWLENARLANHKAQVLSEILQCFSPLQLAAPVTTNAVFAILPESWVAALHSQGFHFYEWYSNSLTGNRKPATNEKLVRFVLSYATPMDSLTSLEQALARLAKT